MKKLMTTLIAVFAILAVGLVFLLVFAITQGSDGSSFAHSSANLVNTQSISLDDIDAISISYQSDDVVFLESDTDELILKEYMNFTPDSNELASIAKTEHELTIKCGQQRSRSYSGIFFSISNCRAEIYLPASYIKKLTVSTSSGDIHSDLTLKLSEFAASSTSGDIRVNEVYADLISSSASSGDITIQTAEGNRKLSATSGDIKVLSGNGNSNFSTSSGDIKIANTSGNLDVNTSSGDINIIDSVGGGKLVSSSGGISLELTDMTENLDINASSGDIRVSIPGATNFDFSAATSSGDIRTFFDDMLSYNKKGNEASGTVGDNAIKSIHIDTTSGDININE